MAKNINQASEKSAVVTVGASGNAVQRSLLAN
jgi:hypothetical protein